MPCIATIFNPLLTSLPSKPIQTGFPGGLMATGNTKPRPLPRPELPKRIQGYGVQFTYLFTAVAWTLDVLQAADKDNNCYCSSDLLTWKNSVRHT